jgi:hypothetical protein
LYDPNEDQSLQRLLDIATHEQLKQLFTKLYAEHQKNCADYDKLKTDVAWEKSARHAERSGGWM